MLLLSARAIVLLPCLIVPACAQDNPSEFFEKRVRPILATKCYSCHTTSPPAGLRLDSRAGMLAGGKSGPAIVPGRPAESLLIRAVTHTDAKLRMPQAGGKLTQQEVADLSSWIQAGAPWPEETGTLTVTKTFHITAEQRAFWSFQPLKKTEPPAVKNTAWAKTQMDRFILARLEEKGLQPVRPADKRSLIRRATYDLTGLPPKPEEVDAFLADQSPDAFGKVVDRLLASPHYGERWARHWLDVARYADGDGPENRPVYIGYGMAKDGFANTFRYRDWVIAALNKDLPYDQFVKAQIAADLLPESGRKELMPALGFFGLGPWFTGDDVVFAEARANERDDKIDALTKAFLGLTVTCARCHDHKYDPISQKDYYALGGVFASSGYSEYDLAQESEVSRYKAQRAKVKAQEKAIEAFAARAKIDVARVLAEQTSRYMMAVRRVELHKLKPAKVAEEEKLDTGTFLRWGRYLSTPRKIEHPFLRPWHSMMAMGGGSDEEAKRIADEFQKLVLDVIAEKTALTAVNDEMRRNYRPDPDEARAALPGDLTQFERFQYKQLLVEKVMDPHRFYIWLDVVQGEQGSQDYEKKDGIYEYDFKTLARFFTPEQRARLNTMLAQLRALEKELPPEYPYVMVISDNPAPANLKLNVRGNPHALGEVVARGLPGILANTTGEPAAFTKGSGRLELAQAIVRHPLAARVMVNRIWMHHFGRGIVGTPSNFGVGGERPTHPELLDYLAGRFIENHWSMKAMHREMMLSATYQLGTQFVEANESADPDNKLFWRGNRRRLDAEEIRDSLLFVSGALDQSLGGPPQELSSAANTRRTVYARIRRSVYACTSGTGGLDRTLQLFDFPDPSISVDQRGHTNVPLQGLFFLNSELVMRQADLLAKRLTGSDDDRARIQQAYRLLFGRPAKESEVQLGIDFLQEAQRNSPADVSPWQQYAQVLLSSNSFYYVN
jgi:cytochrome c553